MKSKIYFILFSGFSLLFSVPVFAHISESGGGVFGGLLHMFTGEHLLTLALVGVFIVGVTHLYRRFR